MHIVLKTIILLLFTFTSSQLYAQNIRKLERAGIVCIQGAKSDDTKNSDILEERTTIAYGFSTDLRYKLAIYYFAGSYTTSMDDDGFPIYTKHDDDGYSIYVYDYQSGYKTPIEISKRYTPFYTKLLIEFCKDYRIDQLIFY